MTPARKKFGVTGALSHIMKDNNFSQQSFSTPSDEIAITFNDYLPQIQSKLNDLDPEKDLYSEGHQGKVYKISIDVAGNKKEFIILKHRLGDIKTSTDAAFEEFKFHKSAYLLLQEHPEIAKDITIPKLYGWIEKDDGYSYIVMDFLSGPTIYAAKIQAVLPIMYDQLAQHLGIEAVQTSLGSKETFIKVKTDKEAKSAMDKIFSLPTIRQYQSKIDHFYDEGGEGPYGEHLEFREHVGLKNILQVRMQQNYPYLEELYAGVFDKLKKQFSLHVKDSERIKNMGVVSQQFVRLMNDNNIYHNDYRSRNIMLCDDDKLGIIDFGSASKQAMQKKEKLNVGDSLLTNRIKSLE
ncbi:MAG: phosphotransferase [candidate division SR1 bacterium]|nr:phosphotransferase [candidate division SR1 bacterium]